jgi:TPR repeat protein
VKYLSKKLTLVIMLFFMLCNVNSVMADSNKDDLIKQAKNGDKVAQYTLANLLFAQRIDKEKYDDEVIYWYKQSAQQGYVKAQFALAMVYKELDNYKEVINWLEKAAEQNHAQAQYYLGVEYRSGFWIHYDHTKAKHWLMKAAKQGYTPAQVELGNLYLTSHVAEVGGNEGYKKAIYWYQKAAEANDPYAQLNLGLIEKESSNYKQALYWFKRACKHNFNDACQLATTMQGF